MITRCSEAIDYNVQKHQVFCGFYNHIVMEEKCVICQKRPFAYKDLDIGQFFFDASSKHYGIKLSSCRAYNIDECRVYGFFGNHANDSDDQRYYKCDFEVW